MSIKLCLTSDLHGELPEIPECDLLVIAGDICPDRFPKEGRGVFPDPEGQQKWVESKFKEWWQDIPAKEAIATWGNHDFVGEIYPNNNITVDALADTQTGLKIWMTPWSNRSGPWAYMKLRGDLKAIYDSIPDGLDILVSHQPPFGYGDVAPSFEHVGSRELLDAIKRAKPKMVVCGHIHGLKERMGYGTYNIIVGDTHIPVYNVAHVNEWYEPVNEPVVIEYEPIGRDMVQEASEVSGEDETKSAL